MLQTFSIRRGRLLPPPHHSLKGAVSVKHKRGMESWLYDMHTSGSGQRSAQQGFKLFDVHSSGSSGESQEPVKLRVALWVGVVVAVVCDLEMTVCDIV